MRYRDALLGVLVLAVLAAGAWWVRGRQTPDASVTASGSVPDVTRADASVDVGDLRFTLSILPRPPVAFDTLKLALRVTDRSGTTAVVPVEGLSLAFQMKMPMGDHRATWVPAGEGRYQAEVTLPMCGTGDPRWFAIVGGTVAGRPVSAVFRFDLSPPREP